LKPFNITIAKLLKYLLVFYVFLFANLASASEVRSSLPISECKHFFPYGLPKFSVKVTLVCREGYVLAYDESVKSPVWVSYTLDKKKATGCFPRRGNFVRDPSIPRTAKQSDYTRSGFDIGHLIPDADMRWSAQTQIESGVFSNAAPQIPSLNRGGWSQLEDLIRSIAVAQDTPLLIQVVTIRGNSFIGKNKDVNVPKAFYKVVVDIKTSRVIGFYYTQEDGAKNPEDAKIRVRALNLPLSLPPKFVESRKIWNTKNAKNERTKSCNLAS